MLGTVIGTGPTRLGKNNENVSTGITGQTLPVSKETEALAPEPGDPWLYILPLSALSSL